MIFSESIEKLISLGVLTRSGMERTARRSEILKARRPQGAMDSPKPLPLEDYEIELLARLRSCRGARSL